jgi:hypothetical protein
LRSEIQKGVDVTITEAHRRIKAYFSKPDAKFGYDTEIGVCQYRAFDHEAGRYRKCAVGVLIPDDKYDDSLEDEVAPRDLVWQGIINGVMTKEEKKELGNFLTSAQEAHDTHAVGKKYVPPPQGSGQMGSHVVVEQTIPAFLRELDDVAKRYGVFV